MGGMGKSSLARMVHNDPDLLDEFDCDAWVTVPHPLDGADVLAKRLRKGLGLAPGQDVREHLRERRYLVVVDDLQSLEEWQHVKVVLFDNGRGSRIIVTTRRVDVAKHCAGRDEHVYELKPLGDVESMDLLCQKVYKTTDYTLPEDMAYQARHILRRCWGLPLAISTIGSLLANRPKTSIEWSKLHEHLGAELESDRNIREVIVSSYDGLPYDLKLIFLYLSIFPENHEIRCTRLLRRWMAEGYIARKRGMPVEDVGERSYNELINRSMIQPSKKKLIPGERVSCRVHSMMLQIILSISTEENQLFLIEKQANEVPQSKIRHLVVSRWKRQDKKLKNINLSYVRSLTIFGDCPASLISPKMQLLRVLDMEDTTNLKNDDLKHVGELHHLRYLSLRGTDISVLPSSLQNLLYLETLDIQDTQVTQLPGGITKLEKLRYLLAGINFTKDLLQKMAEPGRDNLKARFSGNIASYLFCNQIDCCKVSIVDRFSVKAPEGIENLQNLHMLRVVNVGQGNDVAGRIRKLTNLTNLQRLGVAGLTEEEGKELCKSIGKLNRLQRLEVRSESLKFLARMDESVIPRHLVSLRLCGNLTRLPAWISSLNNLAKVKLLGTQLEEGDIVRLENSRNLALLSLWENSYIGKSLRFRTGAFPKLKFLDIDGLEKIEKVIIKKDAMPELEQLWVNKCQSIRDDDSGLSGVPYLPSLNELVLKKCGEKKHLIDILQGQVNKHNRRPKFLIGKSILLASQMSASTTAEQ
ncbi:hypothetical protein ACP70R_006068 [Stipagrostis hirtigluma subsp. patula]